MRVRRGNPILSSVSLSGSPEQEISVKSKLLDLIVKRQISGLGYSRFVLSIILMRSAAMDLGAFGYGAQGIGGTHVLSLGSSQPTGQGMPLLNYWIRALA